MRIWAVKFGGKLRNNWEYSDSPQLQGWEFQDLKKKFVNFSENFLKNHKNFFIAKTTWDWAVLFRDTEFPRVPWQHPITG